MSYGKVFEAIYASTVADNWRGLVTMQQLITLADKDGEVHHTARSISRVTGIPLDIIEPGIEYLLEPDPSSQSKAMEGRRIVPFPEVDGRQPVGWTLINYEYYKQLGSKYESKEKARIRKARQRANEKKTGQGVTCHASHDYTDKDKDKNKEPMSGKPDDPSLLLIKALLDDLNEKAGKKFKQVESNHKFLRARLKEGHTSEDIRAVIDRKIKEWKDDQKMAQYLRPATLFNAEKFNQYVGELGSPLPEKERVIQDWQKIPFGDDDLAPWAEKHGYPKPGRMQTYKQYRSTLLSLARKRIDQEANNND